MSTIITFEEPPGPRGGADRNHPEIAEALKANPGRWARLNFDFVDAAKANNLASTIKSARLSPYRPKGSFQARVRTVDGEVRVYARYIGGAE